MCVCPLAASDIKVELGLDHFLVVHPSMASIPPGIKAKLLTVPKALPIIQTRVVLFFCSLLTLPQPQWTSLSVPGFFQLGVWTIVL